MKTMLVGFIHLIHLFTFGSANSSSLGNMVKVWESSKEESTQEDWKGGFRQDRKMEFGMEPREESSDESSSTLTVAIICATVLAVTVIIAITVISTAILFVKKKEIVEQERQREEEERNDLYGTYYQGVEYNTVIDNNPRYNEDEGNADAAVTDGGKTSYRGAEYSVASESVKIF